MTTVHYLSCSPRGADAWSSRIAEELLVRLAPTTTLRRDLAADPMPPIDAAFSAALLSPPTQPWAEAFAASEAALGMIEAADCLVIATPMHNFGPPAALKCWVDHIVRINRTFRSLPEGKVGLLRDRQAYLVVASGGWFTQASPIGTPPQPDFLTPYMRTVLATIGIVSLRVLVAEGMARGAEATLAGMARVREEMDAWF